MTQVTILVQSGAPLLADDVYFLALDDFSLDPIWLGGNVFENDEVLRDSNGTPIHVNARLGTHDTLPNFVGGHVLLDGHAVFGECFVGTRYISYAQGVGHDSGSYLSNFALVTLHSNLGNVPHSELQAFCEGKYRPVSLAQGGVVAISTAEGRFSEAVAVPAEALPAPPLGVSFPLGMLSFAVSGLDDGGATTVTLTLPPGVHVNSYWKYGSEPANQSLHWYNFSFDGTTGAQLVTDDDDDPDTDRILLHFVDGARGDDFMESGIIADPGAPALLLASGIADVSIVGPNFAVRGQPLDFAFTAQPSGTYRFEIDWESDGTVDETHEADGTLSLTHVYPTSGGFQVSASVSTLSGDASAEAVHGIEIEAVLLIDGTLRVGGTLQSDQIRFARRRPQNQPPQVLVHVNATEFGPFVEADVTETIAYGQSGHDRITLAPTLDVPAHFFGGTGNDVLIGGNHNDVLAGGGGIDVLYGGGGRNLLVGGEGHDLIFGGDGGDLMVGGTTILDDREEALHAVLAEWSSNRPFADRVANLTDGSGTSDRTNGEFFLKKHETVFDDADLDLLFPLGGDDWLFAFGDLVLGAGANDRVER